MITDAPVCYQAAFNFVTPEKTGTFTWHINIDKTNYVLKHGKQTMPSGTYKTVVCINGHKRIRAFANYDGIAKLHITITRWLRR